MPVFVMTVILCQFLCHDSDILFLAGGACQATGRDQEEGHSTCRGTRLREQQHSGQGHGQGHRWTPLGMSWLQESGLCSVVSPASLAVHYHWRELPQVFLLRQKFCHDKHICCDRTCHDKSMLVMTKLLSQQTYFCHEKTCRNKYLSRQT